MKVGALLLFILCLLSSCKYNPPLNPNGDSELAILMREMYEEGLVMKSKLQEGKKHGLALEHNKILTATATEPEKVNTEKYKSLADVYLSNLENYRSSTGLESVKAYHSVVESCMDCHKAICPGPMVKIKKLYIPD